MVSKMALSSYFGHQTGQRSWNVSEGVGNFRNFGIANKSFWSVQEVEISIFSSTMVKGKASQNKLF